MTTTSPRNYVLISIPADLAAEITAYLEAQRAHLPDRAVAGLPVDLPAWIRAAARRELAEAKKELELQAPPATPPQAEPPHAEVVEPAAPPERRPPWPAGPSEPDMQDVPEQAETAPTEVFEGVTIPVGSVHPRGGYVHHRSRRHVLGAALDLGIPAEVVHHRDLLTERQKPSEMGFKRTEALIVRVREAQDRGADPAPLWAKWLPPAARKAA